MNSLISGLLFLCGLSVTQNLFASDLTIMSVATSAKSPPSNPAKPLPSSSAKPPVLIKIVPKIDEVLEVWKSGVLPTEGLLTGSWKTIAQIFDTNCKVATSSWHEDGYKRSDGDYEGTLEFKNVHKPIDKKSYFSVMFKHFATDQGPFEVDSVEPQFAAWASKGAGGEITSEAWTEYSCRLNAADPTQLFCVVRWAGDWSKPAGNDNLKCQKLAYPAVSVFYKVP